MDDLESRLGAWVAAYDAQGAHRTGSEVDLASARWLQAELAGQGALATLDPFRLARLDVLEASVTLGGLRIAGELLHDGGLSGPEGVEGRLGAPGDGTEIALVEAPPMGACSLDDIRKAGRHLAVVAITRGWRPGLAVRNAPDFDAPFGPPVVQLASGEGPRLMQAAAEQAPMRVLAHATRHATGACNVLARIPGSDPAAAPVVVLTPRSGWWACAAERGGGIAVLLEIARAVAAAGPRAELWLLGTSGHELGHMGLRAFEKDHAGLCRRSALWLHLGASIGAAVEPMMELSAASEELMRLASDAVERAGVRGIARVPVGRQPRGEARQLFEAGRSFVGIAGPHATFHQPEDRWPDAVDPAQLAAYARAACGIVLAALGAGERLPWRQPRSADGNA